MQKESQIYANSKYAMQGIKYARWMEMEVVMMNSKWRCNWWWCDGDGDGDDGDESNNKLQMQVK